MSVKFEGLKDKSLWHLLCGQRTWEWQLNVAALSRPQTDVPGIPVGDYYPEILRVSELPQVLMLTISCTEVISSASDNSSLFCTLHPQTLVVSNSAFGSFSNLLSRFTKHLPTKLQWMVSVASVINLWFASFHLQWRCQISVWYRQTYSI